MCAVADQYYRVYEEHIGYPGQYHAGIVKRARQLIEEHRRNCPDCGPSRARSNWNLHTPKTLAHFKPRG